MSADLWCGLGLSHTGWPIWPPGSWSWMPVWRALVSIAVRSRTTVVRDAMPLRRSQSSSQRALSVIDDTYTT